MIKFEKTRLQILSRVKVLATNMMMFAHLYFFTAKIVCMGDRVRPGGGGGGSRVNRYKSIPSFRTIQIIFNVCSTDNEYWIGAKYDASDWVWENGMDITETFPMVRDTSVCMNGFTFNGLS